MTNFAIVEAPSALGLFPGGVERLPAALLNAGLADALGARPAISLAEGVGFEPTELALNGFQEPHLLSTCRDAVAFSLVTTLHLSFASRRVYRLRAVSMPSTLPRGPLVGGPP